MKQRQRQVIDYLREENRVLREQLGDRRLLSVAEAKTRSAGGATLRNVESGCGYAFGAGVS
jgi:hypothetical protein